MCGTRVRCRAGLFLLAVLVRAADPAAGQERSRADYMKDFFKPVEDPVHVTTVPHTLRNLVRLAQNIAGSPDMKEFDPMLPPSVAAEITKAGGTPAPKHDAKIYADDFDPVKLSQWEQVVGGGVSPACGSTWGNAMCFNGEGSRYAVSMPVNTIAGGVVRFALVMHSQGGLPGDVVLEHKAAGAGWVEAVALAQQTFAATGIENPNSELVVHVSPAAAGAGAASDGFFATYAVPIPDAARSPATKFRWRQVREPGDPKSAPWAVDDVSIEIGVDGGAPSVVLNLPGGEAPPGHTEATVVAQFSTKVYGFTAEDVVVGGGHVAEVSGFDGAPAELFVYTIKISMQKEGEVTIRVPAEVCFDRSGVPNRGSNVLVVRSNVRALHELARQRAREAAATATAAPAPATAGGVGSLGEAEAKAWAEEAFRAAAAADAAGLEVGLASWEAARRAADPADPVAPGSAALARIAELRAAASKAVEGAAPAAAGGGAAARALRLAAAEADASRWAAREAVEGALAAEDALASVTEIKGALVRMLDMASSSSAGGVGAVGGGEGAKAGAGGEGGVDPFSEDFVPGRGELGGGGGGAGGWGAAAEVLQVQGRVEELEGKLRRVAASAARAEELARSCGDLQAVMEGMEARLAALESRGA